MEAIIIMRHFRKIKKISWRPFWLTVAIIPLLASCASNRSEAKLRMVKEYSRESDGTNLRTRGFLTIYTPTEMQSGDNNARYYTHTGYHIYKGQAQSPLEYVPNHR